MASGDLTELTASDNGEVNGLAWSTDSAWLAWSHPGPNPLRQLRMTRPGTPGIVDITDGRFIDTDPAFTMDGLYLAFLSRRNFDPVYDTHFFDLSFPYGYRPFLVPLAASTPSPFGPLIDGRPANGRDDDGSKPGADPATPASGSTGNGAATPGASAGSAAAAPSAAPPPTPPAPAPQDRPAATTPPRTATPGTARPPPRSRSTPTAWPAASSRSRSRSPATPRCPRSRVAWSGSRSRSPETSARAAPPRPTAARAAPCSGST